MYLGRGYFNGGKDNSHGFIQVVHLMIDHTSVPEFLQYVVSSGGGFSGIEANTREKRYYRSAAS